RNLPGELGRLNEVFARHKVNIAAQHYETGGDLGYVVLDADGTVAAAEAIVKEIRALPGTIRARMLYRKAGAASTVRQDRMVWRRRPVIQANNKTATRLASDFLGLTPREGSALPGGFPCAFVLLLPLRSAWPRWLAPTVPVLSLEPSATTAR